MSATPSVDHEALVAAQFSPRARAYVDSADHAKGADLERLAALVHGQADAHVLDLGCGGGHVAFTVAPQVADVVAYDLSEAMLGAVRDEAAARGLTTITTERGTAEALPFANASFDFVFTRFSAHHWFDLATGLVGMRRVLKPGGLVVVMDTVSPGSILLDDFLHRIELLRDPSHVRNYTADEWIAALRQAGFRPGAPALSRLPLDFATWIARIGTPETEAKAIRVLQAQAPSEVIEHFGIRPDGSFLLDTMTIEAVGA